MSAQACQLHHRFADVSHDLSGHEDEEIAWMIAHEGVSQFDMEAAIATAHVPEAEDIRSAFEIARTRVLAMWQHS